MELIGVDIDRFYTMTTAGITADVNRNWALDLTPYVRRDAKAINTDDFFPGLMRQFKVKGRQNSIPIFSHTDWFFCNTDTWAQAGVAPPTLNAQDKDWNWDAMVQIAQKTTKRSPDGARIVKPGLEFARMDFWNTPNWIRMWGVELYSNEALASSIPQDVDLNSPRMNTAIRKMWDLVYKYKVVNPAYTSFTSGNVGASMEHGWKVIDFANTKRLKWAIAPLPWAVTNSGTLWPDGLRVSRISKNKEAAWEFVKFLCSPASMETLVTDPKSQRRGSSAARKPVFRETMSSEIAKLTGHETRRRCGHCQGVRDHRPPYRPGPSVIEPVLEDIRNDKVNPSQATKFLDEKSRKGMQILFRRWMRNVKYTGKQI